MKLRTQSPKKKEKEMYNSNNNKEKKKRILARQEEGSRSSQRTCSKDLGQTRGHAVRRINIKVLCMFRFSTKMPLKIQQNPMKELGRDTQRLGILGTCSTAKVGLRQLKRGATKHKKQTVDTSFSST